MKSILRSGVVLTTFLVPLVSFAQSSTGITGAARTILDLINGVLIPLIFAIAFIVFVWGVFKKYILSHGEPAEVEEGHKLILWGLIGFAVMISVWGLVNIVTDTFGLRGVQAPTDIPRAGALRT